MSAMADLRRQHLELLRSGYDGHNRHGGITTMARLSVRRRRRRLHRALRQLTDAYVRPAWLAGVVDSPSLEDYRSERN